MHFPIWLLYASITLVLWGTGSITQKLATNWITTELSFAWFFYGMIAIALAILPTAHVDWHLNPKSAWLAVVGGVLNGLGAMTSFAALERGGKASIVIPLCYLYPVVTILLALAFLRETVTRTELSGMLLSIVAAILLSRESEHG